MVLSLTFFHLIYNIIIPNKIMKKLSRTEALKDIDEFFQKIRSKNSKQIKKIKNLAMSHNLPLKERRKKFCKKCLNHHTNSKTRIKEGIRSTTCEKCGFVSRWKVK